MKLLRRLVAVILLLSTLFALSACANTTIKNDKDVKYLWKKAFLENKPAAIYYSNEANSSPSYATSLTKIKDENIDDILDIIQPLGEISCKKLDLSDLQGYYNNHCLITFYIGDGNFALHLYDDYIVINKDFCYQIDYDKEYIVEQLNNMAELKGEIK